PPYSCGLAEQYEQRGAGGGRDGPRLDAELLLRLQGLQPCAFLGQVGVDQIANTGVERVLKLRDEGHVRIERLRTSAELGESRADLVDGGVDDRDHRRRRRRGADGR